MGYLQRIADALVGPRLAEPTGEERAVPALFTRSAVGVQPPARLAGRTHVSADQSLMILDVYRGIQIITTSVSQLSIDHYVGDRKPSASHSLVRRPSLGLDPAHFFEESALALATCGNAYWRHIVGPSGAVVDLQPLNPAEVIVEINVETLEHKYHWRGQHIPTNRISHLKLMRRTGVALGLGPIQAAQMELAGTIEARDYSSQWLSTTDVPTGILTTDQPITGEQAKDYKTIWRGDGTRLTGHDIRVLGAGLRYAPIALKPADVQFLETRQFNRTGIATLLGIPPSLLNAPVEGGSKTYQNTEDEFIIFNRFTLMAYLRPMEIALSALLPDGQTARFNVEALLRTSTKDRYAAHEIGIRSGFLEIEEVRAVEGLGPRTTTATPARQEPTRADA